MPLETLWREKPGGILGGHESSAEKAHDLVAGTILENNKQNDEHLCESCASWNKVGLKL